MGTPLRVTPAAKGWRPESGDCSDLRCIPFTVISRLLRILTTSLLIHVSLDASSFSEASIRLGGWACSARSSLFCLASFNSSLSIFLHLLHIIGRKRNKQRRLCSVICCLLLEAYRGLGLPALSASCLSCLSGRRESSSPERPRGLSLRRAQPKLDAALPSNNFELGTLIFTRQTPPESTLLLAHSRGTLVVVGRGHSPVLVAEDSQEKLNFINLNTLKKPKFQSLISIWAVQWFFLHGSGSTFTRG